MENANANMVYNFFWLKYGLLKLYFKTRKINY